MGDNQAPETRYPTVEYRVYETPYSVLRAPSDIGKPEIAGSVFAAGRLVNSVTAPGKGGNISFYDAQFVGVGCWFFCVSVNAKGTESLPTPPVENPTHTVLGGGTGDGEGNDSDIPADVTGAQVLLQPENVDGKKLVRATVSALVPSPKGSFAGYQIYLQNYEQENENVKDGQVVEGAWFVAQTNAAPGSVLSGSLRLEPDSPVPYSQGSIGVTAGSTTVDGLENPHWDGSWAAPRRMAFFTTASLQASGAIHRYDNEIASVDATPSAPKVFLNTVSAPWRTQTLLPYVIYRPDTQAIKYKPHPVRLYFVSISRGGTRRPDVLNSPFVEFPFGISLALSKPLNPDNITASFMGGTVHLFWSSVSDAAAFDNTIQTFNIYRARLGTQIAGYSYLPRPSSVYAVVPKETIVSSGGKITWVDRQFNIDPTIPAITPVIGWDLDPTDPAVYAYWVTATNIEGTENRTAYWGQMTVTGTALAWVAGDRFSADYEGQSISNGSAAKVVSPGSWSSLSPNALATNTAFAPNGTYPFYIGPVTGAVVLLGNTGAEDDPTIYRDTFSNRYFNARFYNVCAGNTDKTFVIDHGAAYGPYVAAGDGQPTFNSYYAIYVGAGFFDPTGEAGARYPAGTLGADTDNWSIWQYLRSDAGQVRPYFKAAGSANAGTGEVELDPTGAASATDYTVIWQHAAKSKFLRGEDLVITVYAKKTTDNGGSDVGILRMQMIRYDITQYAGPVYSPAYTTGVERDVVGGDISLDRMTTDYQRFSVIGRLPKLNPAVSSVALTNASTTVTWTSGAKFNVRYVGCTATLDDGIGHTQAVVIEQVSGGSGNPNISDETTLVVNPAWAFASHAGTISIVIKFSHYAFKIGLIGKNKYNIRFTKPMVNGGRVGAAWSPNMRQDDEPGGDYQDGSAGNPDQYDPNKYKCVPAGTPVLTPDGYRPIEEIRPGDKVISRAPPGLRPRMVSGAHHGLVRRLVDLHGEAVTLTCSLSHKLARRRDGRTTWVPAERVKLGDVLIGEVDGTEVLVPIVGIGMRELPSPSPVYTLTIKGGSPNYFAGGLLCHNKPSSQPNG